MLSSRREIGDRIKQLRGTQTQRDFGETLGFSHGFVGDIERGRSFPSVPFLLALADIYGADLTWILTGCEAPPEAAFAHLEAMDKEEETFRRMLEALWQLFKQGCPDTRVWIRMQLQRAVPELHETLQFQQFEAAATETV